MLRYRADIRTLIYMAVTTALLVIQWSRDSFSPVLFTACLFMAVSVAVIAHNHNHLTIWKSKRLAVLRSLKPAEVEDAERAHRLLAHAVLWIPGLRLDPDA